MKFNRLVVYDFNGSDFLGSKLKEFCKELLVFRTDKDFSLKMKPENLRGADAFVAKPFGRYNKIFFSKADKLKFMCLVSTGYDVVDVKFLKSNGVTFANVPHYASEGVAELSLWALLDIARNCFQNVKRARAGEWGFQRKTGFELKGKTLGIIGLGAIGSRVAELAKGFGMEVVYYSKAKNTALESKLRIKAVSLDELLKKSDAVSLHCPLNKETRGLLSRQKLALLKEGAVLLNSARAEICDLDAVKELAASGKIFAWFDALDEAEQRQKLLGIENIIATPHIGWMTKEAQRRLDEIAVENVKSFLEGKPMNVVDS